MTRPRKAWLVVAALCVTIALLLTVWALKFYWTDGVFTAHWSDGNRSLWGFGLDDELLAIIRLPDNPKPGRSFYPRGSVGPGWYEIVAEDQRVLGRFHFRSTHLDGTWLGNPVEIELGHVYELTIDDKLVEGANAMSEFTRLADSYLEGF